MEEKVDELIRVYDDRYPGDAREKVGPFLQAAEACRKAGNPGKAIPIYERALAILRATESRPSFELVMMLAAITATYNVCGRYREAIGPILEAISIVKRDFPERTAELYTMMNNLACSHLGLEEYDKGEKIYVEILAMSDSVLKAKKESIAATHHQLGYLHFKKGDYVKAEASLSLALTLKRQLFGASHPQVGMTLNNLAALHDKLGLPDAASLRNDAERMLSGPAAPYRTSERGARSLELRCLDPGAHARDLVAPFVAEIEEVGFNLERAFTVGESQIYEELILPPIVTLYIQANDFVDPTASLARLAASLASLVSRFRALDIVGYGSGPERRITSDAGIFVRSKEQIVSRYYFRPGEYTPAGFLGAPRTLTKVLARAAASRSSLGNAAYWGHQQWQSIDPETRQLVALE